MEMREIHIPCSIDKCPCQAHDVPSGEKEVRSRGPADAEVVVVGEAPGDDEVHRGEVFVGPAGKVLVAALAKAGFDPDKILFTNAMRCRMPDGKKPPVKWIKQCRDAYLFRELTEHPRTLIIALGNTGMCGIGASNRASGVTKIAGAVTQSPALEDYAQDAAEAPLRPAYNEARAIASKAEELSQERADELEAQFLDDAFAARWPAPPIVVTLHPAATLYRSELLGAFESQMQVAYNAMEQPQVEVAWEEVQPQAACSMIAHWLQDDAVTAVALDVEADSKYAQKAWPSILGLCADGEKGWVVRLPDTSTGKDGGKESAGLWDAVRELLGSGKAVPFNGMYDHWVLERWLSKSKAPDPEVKITPRWAGDPMLAHYVYNENEPHGLKPVASKMLGVPVWGKGVEEEAEKLSQDAGLKEVDYTLVPFERLAPYCAMDAVYTWRVHGLLNAELQRDEALWQCYRKFYLPLARRYMRMMQRGFLWDQEAADVAAPKLEAVRDESLAYLQQAAEHVARGVGDELKRRKLKAGGELKEDEWEAVDKDGNAVAVRIGKQRPFNPGSFLQLGRVLYGGKDLVDEADAWSGFGFEPPLYTAGGVPSTNEDTVVELWRQVQGQGDAKLPEHLQRLYAQSPEWQTAAKAFLHALLRWRKSTKLGRDFVVKFGRFADSDGAIRGGYLLHGTETGRTSCTDPPMQTDPEGLRYLFVARLGYKLVRADYIQGEVAMWGILSRDQDLLRLYYSGADFHAETASEIYGVRLEDVTKEQRQRAKNTVVFASIYGQGVNSISRTYGIPLVEAQTIYRFISTKYPVAWAWLDSVVELARKEPHELRMPFGRKRRLMGITSDDDAVRSHAEREARNCLIQGTASDMTKWAGMLRVPLYGKEWGIPIAAVVETHDEVVYEVPEEFGERAVEMVRTAWQEPIPGTQYWLRADVELRDKWAEPGLEEAVSIDAVLEDSHG